MVQILPNMHPDAVTNEVAYALYLCHSLSTWNARMYEFAAVVFTAEAFLQDLVASSILYAVAGAHPLCRAWLTEMQWYNTKPMRPPICVSARHLGRSRSNTTNYSNIYNIRKSNICHRDMRWLVLHCEYTEDNNDYV